jgi:hypothetical protein
MGFSPKVVWNFEDETPILPEFPLIDLMKCPENLIFFHFPEEKT